jgi:mannitol-specific phosphotransferase system IIBC component
VGTIAGSNVSRVVVACEAGMGSSVLLTTQLSKRFKKLGIEVVHSPVHALPPDAQVVVCHEGLANSARLAAPDAAIVTFRMFLGDPAFDRLEKAIKSGEVIGG